MRLMTNGSTRLVLIVGPYALKFPRGRSGMRCNALEAEIWAESKPERRQMLCPVLAALPFGLLVVMAAAEPITEAEAEELMETDGFPDWDYIPGEREEPFEYNYSNWGRIDGRLVSLDYSAPAICFDGSD